jgi:predicted DNA binding CopG/RHH family protein
MSLTFDNEERELLTSFEHDEWQSIPDLARELEQYRQYAAATNERHRRVSVRLGSDDFERLQQQAEAAGLSRETLIEQIVHQYIAGELVERA